jgi:hypothetical protein
MQQYESHKGYFRYLLTISKLKEKVEKYHIKPHNTYNFDEKGFLIGLCHSMKRIVALQHLLSKKILGASQDGSREFISLLACICADGTALPPALIYQGTSSDLQDTWLEDFDHSSDRAYFTTSEKGWTNEELGMKWLQIFNHHTKEKAGNSRRLLLVDGHSSHVNLRFIDYCDKNRIILGVLPPHSTHRLQPLDVGIFSPLAHAYSQEIDHLIQSSCGFSRLTKRSFWKLFSAAWNHSVTSSNIKSAFSSPGIYPLRPERVLSSLRVKTPSPESSDQEEKRKTPTSVRGVRRLTKQIHKEQVACKAQMEQLIHACEKFAIQNDILRSENTGLRTALVDEKKKRKRGKGMGLFDKEKPGEARFYGPEEVAAVRERAKELEIQAQLQKDLMEEKRIEQARRKEQKAQEKEANAHKREQQKQARIIQKNLLIQQREERKAEALIRKQIQQENKAQQEVLKKAAQEQRQNVRATEQDITAQRKTKASKKTTRNTPRDLEIPSRPEDMPSEGHSLSADESMQNKRISRVSRTGRKIVLPPRFSE